MTSICENFFLNANINQAEPISSVLDYYYYYFKISRLVIMTLPFQENPHHSVVYGNVGTRFWSPDDLPDVNELRLGLKK